MHMIAHIIWMLGALGGGLLLLVYLFQDKLVYIPNIENSRREFLQPSQFGLHRFEEVFVQTQDNEKIQVWLLKVDNAEASRNAPTMLYFHGNAGNISHRLPHIANLIAWVGCNVVIVSYRGYGLSTGSPNEHGIKLDSQAVLDYLSERTDINTGKIFLFGSSLGGAVAIDLAHANQHRIKALVVENSFTSITDMVDCVLPALRYFKFLVTNPWNSLHKVGHIRSMPVLFMSGAKDELVPEWMMKKLYESCASGKKKFLSFPTGRHVDTFTCKDYYPGMKTFLDTVFEAKAE